MDTKDLKNKTIFDFCQDEKLIESIIGDDDKTFYISNAHVVNKMRDILRLSEITSNKELEKLAKKTLREVKNKWESHVENAPDEVIID